jgi:hypothetical protein
MNDPRWKRKEERFPGLTLWETTVIVNRRTAVFVPRTKHVIVGRARVRPRP